MATVADYVGLITAYQRGKPRFAATVAASVTPFAAAQGVTAGISGAFDLDAAVGVQLDILGRLIGCARHVSRAYTDTYFSFDDPARGLDTGIIMGPFDPTSIAFDLDDDHYRRLLRAKALANRLDGTLAAMIEAMTTDFAGTGTQVFVEDGSAAIPQIVPFAFDTEGAGFDEGFIVKPEFAFDTPGAGFDEGFIYGENEPRMVPARADMGLTLCVAGTMPSLTDLAVLDAHLIPIKPQGVHLTTLVTSVDGAPLFGFDMDTDLVAGFDEGAIGVSPRTLLERAA